MMEMDGPDDWKKRQEANNSRLAAIAKKSGSKIAEVISDRREKKADATIDQNCEMISTLCYEAQEQLRSGKMTIKEVIKELCDALECVPDVKYVKPEKGKAEEKGKTKDSDEDD